MEFARDADLITRVIDAAPEGQAQRVKSWLESLAAARAGTDGDRQGAFDSAVRDVAAAGPQQRQANSANPTPGSARDVVSPGGAPHSAYAFSAAIDRRGGADHTSRAIDPQGGLERGEQQLRAFVVQMMIEEMLPEDVIGLGGEANFASGIWRSMLAEKLAVELAPAIDLDLLPDAQAHQSAKAVDGARVQGDPKDEGVGT